MKKIRKISVIVIVLAIIAVIAGKSFVIPFLEGDYKNKTTVVSKSNLEKVLQINELSTSTAVYNGVSSVTDPEDSDKVLYYVSYDATVKAGINTEDIQIEVRDSEEEKKVIVTLPKVTISDIEVNMGSLEYIFKDKNSNTESISKDAYQSAVADVKEECEKNEQLKELAKENAKNVIQGLISPILEQEEYQLEIRSEGDK